MNTLTNTMAVMRSKRLYNGGLNNRDSDNRGCTAGLTIMFGNWTISGQIFLAYTQNFVCAVTMSGHTACID